MCVRERERKRARKRERVCEREKISNTKINAKALERDGQMRNRAKEKKT